MPGHHTACWLVWSHTAARQTSCRETGWIGGSGGDSCSFVLQGQYGLSEQQFWLAFGAGAAGLIAAR